MRNKFLTLITGLSALNVAAMLTLAESNSAPSLSSASAPAVAWSAGALRINGADHTGSGNVLPGGKLEMLRAPGQLYLADGTRMRLSASTRLTIEQQNVSLDSGVARIDSIPSANRPLHISAGELRVTAVGGTINRVRPEQLIVTAATTPTAVRRSGVLVAMVQPGETLSFTVLREVESYQAQSGASAAPADTPVAEDEQKKRCKDAKNTKEFKRMKCAAVVGAVGAAGAAGGIAGVSTAVIAGVVVATVAGVAASVALVTSGDANSNTISQ